MIESPEADKDHSHKRQILARRPSYRKILNELGAGEISGNSCLRAIESKIY